MSSGLVCMASFMIVSFVSSRLSRRPNATQASDPKNRSQEPSSPDSGTSKTNQGTNKQKKTAFALCRWRQTPLLNRPPGAGLPPCLGQRKGRGGHWWIIAMSCLSLKLRRAGEVREIAKEIPQAREAKMSWIELASERGNQYR